MANRITLEAHPRTVFTKSERNRIRRRGDIPGIVYGKDRTPQSIYLTGESFKQLKGHGAVLVDVRIAGDGTVSAMIKDIERGKLKREVLHVDLNVVSLDKPLDVTVPVFLDGLEAVEKRGAVIQQHLREVEIRCLPTVVPEFIMHNIANMQIGENLFAGSLNLPDGVVLNTDTTEVICNIIEAKNAPADTEINPEQEPAFIHGNEDTSKPRAT